MSFHYEAQDKAAPNCKSNKTRCFNLYKILYSNPNKVHTFIFKGEILSFWDEILCFQWEFERKIVTNVLKRITKGKIDVFFFWKIATFFGRMRRIFMRRIFRTTRRILKKKRQIVEKLNVPKNQMFWIKHCQTIDSSHEQISLSNDYFTLLISSSWTWLQRFCTVNNILCKTSNSKL